MQKFFLLVLILIVFCSIHSAYTQQKSDRLGIINAMATSLPFPKMTQEAAKACVGGKVEVKVRFHAYRGNVISAEAISGNKLLQKSSVKAAKKAKFTAININGGRDFYITGIIVYDFAQPKCVSNSLLNKKAKYIPKPQISNIPENVKINYPQTVFVQIYIDEKGNVTSAKSVSGHPLLHPACEISAQQAKFSPLLVNLKLGNYISGILRYEFKSARNIKF